MKQFTIKMVLHKETKNTFHFKAEGAPNRPVNEVYLSKVAVEQRAPKSLTVLVTCEDEA